MWSSRPLVRSALLAVSGISAVLLLSACTVEPLNASRTDSSLATGNVSTSTRDVLASITVNDVKTRTGQQVRNALLFALNGGREPAGGQYRVNLTVTTVNQKLAVEQNTNEPTAAQVRVFAGYALVDKESGATVSSGKRNALASYDRTPQSFANERAERDAENRAAKQVAEQIYLSLASTVAGL